MTSRSYPDADVKKLYALSGGYCAYPNCGTKCVVDKTDKDPEKNIGKIAHIVAHSNTGPRSDPNMPMKQRDKYENWVLLCPTHHDLVDAQPNTFTIEALRDWKRENEAKVRRSLELAMTQVTFSELDSIARALITNPSNPSSNFTVTDPQKKMERNNLVSVRFMITMGLGKAGEVEHYINHEAMIHSDFPERLKAGFVNQYNKLLNEGIEGDTLFTSLLHYAVSGLNQKDDAYRAAAIAILCYLFERCEVFEP